MTDDANTSPTSTSEKGETIAQNSPQEQGRTEGDNSASPGNPSTAVSVATSDNVQPETSESSHESVSPNDSVGSENVSLGTPEQVTQELTKEEKDERRKKANDDDLQRLRNDSIRLTLLALVFAHSALATLLIALDVPVGNVFGKVWWLLLVVSAGLSWAICNEVYRNIRKGLLVRHRLYVLAGQSRSGSGFLAIALPGVACVAAAFMLAIAKCRVAGCSTAPTLATYGLLTIGALAFSVWLLHLADYSYVTRLLSGNKTKHLSTTIGWLSDATVARLEETEKLHIKLRGRKSLGDDLPDREIGQKVLKTLLANLQQRLNKFQDDDKLNLLMEMYGDVVALFHPDYLPHLAHVYLKISQLRALNMAPRRIQLLGRRWTVKGLESEYVVVHDISELRPEYFERTYEVFSGERSGDSSAKDAANKGAAPQVPSTLGDEGEARPEPKWKQRSLKKRAIVTVAPDGSLLSILIEEERQFNI